MKLETMGNNWRPTLGGVKIHYPRASLVWVVVWLVVGFVGAFVEMGEVAIIGFIGVLSTIPLQIWADSRAGERASKKPEGSVVLAQI